MLAINHASLSLVSALGVSVYFNQPLFLPVLLLVVFAGVLPDIDHPNSELGKFALPIAKVLPHRGITHSFLGVLIVYVLFSFLFSSTNIYVLYALITFCFFGVYLTEKILKKHILSLDDITGNIISESQARFVLKLLTIVVYISFALIALVIWNNALREQLFLYTMIGFISHLFGDFVTKEGIPLFIPIKKKYGLKLFRTGSIIEGCVGFLLFCGFCYLIYKHHIEYDIFSVDYWIQYI